MIVMYLKSCFYFLKKQNVIFVEEFRNYFFFCILLIIYLFIYYMHLIYNNIGNTGDKIHKKDVRSVINFIRYINTLYLSVKNAIRIGHQYQNILPLSVSITTCFYLSHIILGFSLYQTFRTTHLGNNSMIEKKSKTSSSFKVKSAFYDECNNLN